MDNNFTHVNSIYIGSTVVMFNVKLCFLHEQEKRHFPFPKHQKAPFTVTEHN